ncbi:MAG: CvpA family protein [Candidatus Limnocylindrales bacterium]
MDIVGAITNIKGLDLVIYFAFAGMFILGYMQGVIRRLVGIGTTLLSLLVAAQLREPLGSFLASNWTQYTRDYNYMLAFGFVFLAGFIGSLIATQLFFKPVPLFARYPVLDELLGGFLGLLQGALFLAVFFLITDPFFTVSGTLVRSNEIVFLRQFHEAFQGSVTASVVRDQIVPALLFFVGGLFPSDVTSIFRD